MLYTEYSRSHLLRFIDRLLTHPLWGMIIFIFIMASVSYMTFISIGPRFNTLFSLFIAALTDTVSDILRAFSVSTPVHSLIVDGICSGVGTVLSFLPTIALLFLFLSLLEEIGYTKRVAYLLDAPFRRAGLSGSDAIPLLMGFGCSVPSILTASNIPFVHRRRVTTLMIPFMSCSAKLPIYIFFIDAFFPNHKGAVLLSLYALGIILALILALMYRRIYSVSVFNSPPPLTSYAVPSLKNVFSKVLFGVSGFVKKAFTVIFIASIIIWFLQSFDSNLLLTSRSENSLLSAIGQLISPFFEPLGFGNWRSSTAIVAGLSGKEAVVSTLAVLMDAASSSFSPQILHLFFSPASAYSFMVFCLLYTPCIATLITVSREWGHIKYALFITFFQIGTAWLVSFFVYRCWLCLSYCL